MLGVSYLQEQHMANCFDVAFKSGVMKHQRRAKVAKTADWQLLEKSWKAILIIALDETEIPSDDEENNQPARSSRMSRRRGRMTASSPLDWLPNNDDLLNENDYDDAYKYAALLINRKLKLGDWNDDLTNLENLTKEACNANGVAKIWQDLGGQTQILFEFCGFPVSKKKTVSKKKFDQNLGKIDPRDTASLLASLNGLSHLCKSAEEQIAMKKVQSQLSSNRNLEPPKILYELDGESVIISVLLAMATGNNLEEPMKKLAKLKPDLAIELQDLANLYQGIVDDWQASRNCSGDDGLSTSRRKYAWLWIPDGELKLSSDEIKLGLDILQEMPDSQNQQTNLKWRYLTALSNEGKDEQAIELLVGSVLDNSIDIVQLSPVLENLMSDKVEQWLSEQLKNLDEGSLSFMITKDFISLPLKNSAIKLLQDIDGEAWEENKSQAVGIFTQCLELRRLTSLVNSDTIVPIANPLETLMVSHLLSAKGAEESWNMLQQSRELALTSVHSTQRPDYMSEVSFALIMLMEGNSINDEVFTFLGKRGYQGLKLARRELKERTLGVTTSTNLEHIITSLEEANLSELEISLFNLLISVLKLNQARLSLQHGESGEEIFAALNEIVSSPEVPTRIIQSIRSLIFEHDIGLDSMVSWYQKYSPLSPYHTLSRAALYAQNNDELNAAREYKRAAESSEFNFEQQMSLNRKAIIHLAHSEQWKEAIDLLEAKPSLKTAITKKFQLYLRVSFLADKQKTQEATNLLRNFAAREKQVEQENIDGEVEVKTVRYFAEDALDAMRNYPFEHPRELPTDPFMGRVTAALTSIHNNNRRNRGSFDGRFRMLLNQESPVIMDIYNLARDSADKNPIEGLMYLERAQNSGKFASGDLKKLFEAERSLFAKYRKQITNSSRRYLRNLALPPLVIVDTNVLFSALIDKIANRLELASETSIDLLNQDNFHKVLSSKAEAGKIKLWLPNIVKHELKEIAKSAGKIRAKFSNSMVKPELLEQMLEKDEILNLAMEVIEDFSIWKPLDVHLEKEALTEESMLEVDEFLVQFTEIYQELTEMKKAREPKQKRTKISGKEIYPELADKQIMAICKYLATRSLEEVGSILVASKDGDFTLTARAFEENYGYGIVRDSKSLLSWLN